MYYQRSITDCWTQISEQFPVLLLTGPRQVGKTTFLQHICEKDRTYVTLDDPAVRMLANDDPALFFQRFKPPLLIDEIQYCPALLPYIKMIVDTEKKQGAFWLTGSQQFQMMKGISETLAGRIAIINLLGFSNRERRKLKLDVEPFLPDERILNQRREQADIVELVDVYKDIWLGGFPALIAGRVKNRDVFYSSYLQTYLQRDIRDLTQVGSETTFLRFLKICAARTGQLLNLSELARDADISVNTAKNWLGILQASFQIFLLQPYHSNLTKRLIKSPKLYFLDTGLCAYLTEWSSPETMEAGAMAGAIFETYVLTEILKSWWHRAKQLPQLYYYRSKDGQEIDFLFVQNQAFYPVEVKKSATPARRWIQTFASLDRFNLKPANGGVICLCKQLLPISQNHYAIPVWLL